MTIEHKDIPDANLHEAKGAFGASSGQVLTAVGDGTATFQNPTVYSNVEVGWYDYNDLTTQSSPIALTTASTYYYLTNDGAGVNTKVIYGVNGIANLWNTSTNVFDFSGLSLGDVLDIRVDVTPTTGAANTALDIVLELAYGTGTPVDIPLINPTNIKIAGATRIIAERSFYMGTTLTKDNPAKIKMRADNTGTTVKVNGWFTRVVRLG